MNLNFSVSLVYDEYSYPCHTDTDDTHGKPEQNLKFMKWLVGSQILTCLFLNRPLKNSQLQIQMSSESIQMQLR